MVVRPSPWIRRDVSPLELFFDLVFVFAVGQLSHHLVGHLGWRGAGETVVMLVAVLGVWAFTSFEVTLLDVERTGTKAVTVGVMGLGFFMNAGITRAFTDNPWLFVVTMELALVVPSAYAAAAAPSRELRLHFVRVLAWVGTALPFWLVGAAVEPRARLWSWAAAAVLDVVGTWSAHPMPGRVTRTARLPFDAEHMLERMRLLLIILLGETVLALGRAVSEEPSDGLLLALALAVFIALVCLWAIYFGRAEQLVVRHVAGADDPIRAVHRGINVLYGVFGGLVLTSVGSELVLARAHDARAGVAGVLVLVGPMTYVLSQAVYFRLETGGGWQPRVLGGAALGVAALVAYWVPAYAAVTLLVMCLLALTAYLMREPQPAAYG